MTEVIFLGANEAGDRVYEWLTDRDDTDVLALLTEQSQLETVERLAPDWIISAGFRHVVPEEILEVPTEGAINLHLSYLPYNRGMNPNVWSILENDPTGVSIHRMVPELDAGPILARRSVPVRPDDDGRDVYDRLTDELVALFEREWPDIRHGDVSPVEQSSTEGTYHHKSEFVDLWELNQENKVRVGDLLNQLRALTFPPFKNAYFVADGEKYYVDLQITHEDNVDQGTTDNIPSYNE